MATGISSLGGTARRLRLATGISSLESDRGDALADAIEAAIVRDDVGNECEVSCLS